ncbi:C2H2-type zinc finger protein [Halorientalis marina]|uniref:C2H2-type zinc finger protein n=1 Tax=Halorientalis marina TaxID=2931976 RepID=UPI001FF59443|nr:C2H2-type zinc finger protein [Halorientalis marina]
MTTSERPPEQRPAVPDGYVDPDGDDHVACEYCGAPFADEELLALHRGLDHEGRLTETEREAFESAYGDEAEDIRLFRLKALAVLVALYFFLLMTYSVFA